MKRSLAENRIYFLFAMVLLLSVCLYPIFLDGANIKSILDNQTYLIVAAIGFSVVMIIGQLDLSIGSVMTFGMIVFLHSLNHYGLIAALILTTLGGGVFGFINGWLVAKVKVDSFIVTLATMIIIENINKIITNAELLSLNPEYMGLQETLSSGFGYFSIQSLLAIALVVLANVFMLRTSWGRNLYLIGANEQTAWFSGIQSGKYVIGSFVASGLLAALGGAFYAICSGASSFDEGPGSLMTIIAAVIVGGVSMQGGRGSVFQSLIAILALASLVKLFNLLGARESVINITNGAVLGLVILYDAYQTYKQKKIKGQRHELMEELSNEEFKVNLEEDEDMQKNNNLTIICITAIACTAIVAIMAMVLKKPVVVYSQVANSSGVVANAQTPVAKRVDAMSLKATDGQDLLPSRVIGKALPEKVANYKQLPEQDANRWFDEEYGIQLAKPLADMPQSPGDGSKGKNVVLLKFVEHPYLTALEKGAQAVADSYEMNLKVLSANNKHSLQAQQVEQVILEKPDLVIIHPVNASASVTLLKKLYEAKIPVIVANQRTTNEGLKYALAWSGPDDWGNARKLSSIFVDKMSGAGEYALIRHFEGNTCYTSRTWGFVTEIAKLAPGMKCVSMEATKLNKEKTRKAVAGWLKQFPNLKGIISGDDSETILGIKEACDAAGRKDMIVVASGNSKVGMDMIKAGFVTAINYQSAEMDGALPVQLAADWFSGKGIENFINYMPKMIMNQENIEEFYPPQW